MSALWVDYDIVWDVVVRKIPELRLVVLQMILDAEQKTPEADQASKSEEFETGVPKTRLD